MASLYTCFGKLDLDSNLPYKTISELASVMKKNIELTHTALNKFVTTQSVIFDKIHHIRESL